MSVIEINNQALIDRLDQVASRLVDTSPLAAAIAGTFATVTDDNFAAGGRPQWAGLSPDGSQRSMLHQSGELRARVVTSHTQTEAIISNNMPYAAIHQFGGKTRPHVILPKYKKALAFGGGVFKKVNHPGSDIPARPYLPMDEHGILQSEAEQEVIQDVDHYWQKIFNP